MNLDHAILVSWSLGRLKIQLKLEITVKLAKFLPKINYQYRLDSFGVSYLQTEHSEAKFEGIMPVNTQK